MKTRILVLIFLLISHIGQAADFVCLGHGRFEMSPKTLSLNLERGDFKELTRFGDAIIYLGSDIKDARPLQSLLKNVDHKQDLQLDLAQMSYFMPRKTLAGCRQYHAKFEIVADPLLLQPLK